MVDISVVIPCYNGAATLARQLDALLAQATDFDFEICVADNRSVDESAAIIRSYASRDDRIRYVSAHGAQGINHARNAGVQGASGEWIVLCDADDVVQPGWIQAYGRAFRGGSAQVGGPLRPIVDGEPGPEQQSFIDSPWVFQWPYGANCGFTRATYDLVDGFDESYRGGGDETDFFWRTQLLGIGLDWVAEARVDYYSRGSSKAVFRQKYAYGLSEVKLFSRFREHGMPRGSVLRAPAAIVISGAGYLIQPRRRRAHAARLGRNLGRIAGSFKHRTLYL